MMACLAFEPRILARLDAPLPAEDAAALEAHLAGCPQCRALSEALRQLDTALSRHLEAPALSPAFATRLRARWAEQGLETLAARRAARKARWEAEFQARLAEWRRRSGWRAWCREGLGYTAVPCLAALVLAAAPNLPALRAAIGTADHGMVPWLAWVTGLGVAAAWGLWRLGPQAGCWREL